LSNKKVHGDLIEVNVTAMRIERRSPLSVMVGSTLTALTAQQNPAGARTLPVFAVLIFTCATGLCGLRQTPDKSANSLMVVQREFFSLPIVLHDPPRGGALLMGHSVGSVADTRRMRSRMPSSSIRFPIKIEVGIEQVCWALINPKRVKKNPS
jgi:hypothetical protein